MRAKFCAVKHEAVFEVTSGLDAGQVVRLPFHDSETADRDDCFSVTPRSFSDLAAETPDKMSAVFDGLPPFGFSIAASIWPALRSARSLISAAMLAP